MWRKLLDDPISQTERAALGLNFEGDIVTLSGRRFKLRVVSWFVFCNYSFYFLTPPSLVRQREIRASSETRAISPEFLEGVQGVVLVFDVTNRASFSSIRFVFSCCLSSRTHSFSTPPHLELHNLNY